MGVFGLSVPAEYGGYSEGGDGEYIAMVVATEELSRASLGDRRVVDHTARDPHSSTHQGRHRGTEAVLAAEAGDG